MSREQKYDEKKYEKLKRDIVSRVERSYKSWFVCLEQAKTIFKKGDRKLETIREMCERVKFSPEQIKELKGKTDHTIILALRVPGSAKNKKIEKRITQDVEEIYEVLFSKTTDHLDKSQIVFSEEPIEDLPLIIIEEPNLR